MIRFASLIFAGLVGWPIYAACGADANLSFAARLTRRSARIGDAIALVITLKNTEGESMLVPVSEADFEIAVDGKTYSVPHFTAPANAVNDDCIPLRPHSEYSWMLPVVLNSFTALPDTGWLGAPGSHTIRVTYSPKHGCAGGETVACVALSSASLTFNVDPPTADTLRKWRDETLKCPETQSCDTILLANRYQVIRDPSIADAILTIYRHSAYSYWLLDAIVFQRRRSDAAQLRELAGQVDDADIKMKILTAAAVMERQ